MFDWDDLRHFLATVRTGTYSAAAAELGVNRTTVARRVAVLERRAGDRLLEATVDGLRPTDTGKLLLATAVAMEQQVQAAAERLAAGSDRICGPLKLATPTGLGAEFVPEFAAFCRAYPDVELELVAGSDPAALVSARKADVGLVVTNHPPEHLTGIAVGELTRAVYCGRGYAATSAPGTALRHHRWVGWGQDMAHALMHKWMQANLPADIHIALRVNSWTAMREAVAADLGISYLWCFLADGDARLVQLRPPEPALSMGLWLLVHEDVPPTRRATALLELLPELLRHRIRHGAAAAAKPASVRRRVPDR